MRIKNSSQKFCTGSIVDVSLIITSKQFPTEKTICQTINDFKAFFLNIIKRLRTIVIQTAIVTGNIIYKNLIIISDGILS